MTESIALGTQIVAGQAGAVALRPATSGDRNGDAELARAITRKASLQTYLTIRLLADREYADVAYRLYAYFRWVDDLLDEQLQTAVERSAFLQRQQLILERCYQGVRPAALCAEEQLLWELASADPDRAGGLATYMREMMAVMAFDAQRKGRPVTAVELEQYTGSLATAVTEALHYCIGHGCYAPGDERRYHAVRAAHITHMLRDTVEDTANGYCNIPQEYLATHGIVADDFESEAFRAWVKARVTLARKLFASGKRCVAQVENGRCRMAGYAYIARFEIVLDLIETDAYLLREAYPERKEKKALLAMTAAVAKQVTNNSLQAAKKGTRAL